MTVDWSAFAAEINRHQRFLLTSHIRPDCDALGSELGMAAVLRVLGKDVTVVNGQATPPNLAFIDPGGEILALGESIQPAQLNSIDAIMILDTSAWAQLGPMAEVVRASQATKLLVDHHVGEDDLGALLFKDVTAEATGRLVVEAAAALNVTLTPAMARPLFAALATDTGWFRFSSTSATTYHTAARLVAAGAEPAVIYGQLYEQETLGRIRLRGLILSRLEVELHGRLIHTYVESDDYARAGALPSDTEDAINTALAVAGTQVAVIVVEQPQGGCKISFRSRWALDCSQVARHFGGGGHKAAAGAFLDQPLRAAQQLVLEHIRRTIQLLDATLASKEQVDDRQ
jgi:phosphoesterase RecJ-like protein